MICNILCVGTELLLGQIDDTNSSYIAREFADVGIESFEHRRVGDNHQRIYDAMQDMLSYADALIVTGGLGPTHDDITRDVAADLMGAELVVDESIVETMRAVFKRRQREMSQNNIRQAMVPVGATPLLNPLGTAPGLQCPIEVGGRTKLLFLVPGVPHEMHYMIENYVIPTLNKLSGENAIVTRTLKTWGLPESTLAEMLDDFVQAGETGDVKVGFLARGINGIYVKLSVSASQKQDAIAAIAPVEKIIAERLGDVVYGYDDQTMESIVVEELSRQSLSLGVAESLTGGMVTGRLVSVPGASDVLSGGVVSYTTDVKTDLLGVTAADVYSHECAEQMARGAREKLKCDIALSTTGVAGPGPDQGHDQGEVFVGISTRDGETSYVFRLGGDRVRVREYATITALNVLRQHLAGNSSSGLSSE